MTKEPNNISPFDEDRHYRSQTKGRKISTGMSPLQQQALSTPPSSSSSSNTMAANLGSSISDLGQSLFHNLDKVSSHLVGEAAASFFADQSVSDEPAGENSPHRLAIPPPGLPMLRVMTEASTFTDEDERDPDLESVDDDKTVQANNKAATLQERRIARLREDKRRIEWTREEISPRKVAGEGGDNEMPNVSPSKLAITPPRQAHYKDRRVKTMRKEKNEDGSMGRNVLPKIPELRKATTLADMPPICDDDDVEQKSRDDRDIGGVYTLAFVPLQTKEDTSKKSVLTDSPEENTKSEETKTPAVAKEADEGEENCSSTSNGSSFSGSNGREKKKARKRFSLSKLTLAAILLIAFGLVLILASVLRPSRGNSLRGSASTDASSTSSNSEKSDSTTQPTQVPYELTVDATDDLNVGIPIASPRTRGPTATPSKAHYPTASPTSYPTLTPTESQVEIFTESQEGSSNIFEINDAINDDENFSFYVVGKSPKLIRTELKNIDDGEFIVHLGDIFSAKDQDCDEKAYDDAVDLLRKAQMPVLALPGDGDWIGCSNVKPKRALNLWRNSFVGIEKNWKGKSKVPGLVQRSKVYAENFAFMFRGVLFLGINNVYDDNDEDEFNVREKETKIFIRSQVKTFESDPSLRSVVVFNHAYGFNDPFDWISQRLGKKNVQVVQIHADKSSSPNGSFLDVPIDNALPVRLTLLNGRLLIR